MTDTARRSAPTSSPPAPTAGRPGAVVFGSLLLVMSLAALDQTIISTALRSVVAELGSVSALSWVVTVYLLASTATAPLWGRLGDARGRKRMLVAAVVIFLAASCLSGAATSIGMLIAARAVQGAGAGGLMALASAGVADLVDPRQRGKYMGYVQSMFAVASVLGPLAGGLIVDHVSWRWVFYVNLPIGLLGLVGLLVAFPAQSARREVRIDYLGATLLAATVVLLELVVLWGGRVYGWTSPTVIGLAVGCLVALGLLVWRQVRASDPILPPRMLADPTVRSVSLALFIATASLFAATTFVPLYLQVVRGRSPMISGLLLIPMMLGITATSVIVGRAMSRTGRYKIFPVLGMIITAAALFGFSRLGPHTSWVWVLGCLLAAGVGFGMVTQVLVVAIQNSVERPLLGSATATANLFRSLGGAVGVAVLGAVFNHGLVNGSGGSAAAERLVADPSSAGSGATPAALLTVNHGLSLVFVVAAVAALSAALICGLITERPAPQWGGQQQGGQGGGGQPGAGGSGQAGRRVAAPTHAPAHARPR